MAPETVEMVIENVAAMDHDYVYTEQRVSYNGGRDFETTASWKHLRDETSVRMANEWVSTPRRTLTIPDIPPKHGCGRIEFGPIA